MFNKFNFSVVILCVMCHQRVDLGVMNKGIILLTDHSMFDDSILFCIMSSCSVKGCFAICHEVIKGFIILQTKV